MKPVVFVLSAVILYAFANVVLEQKLAKYNTASVLIYTYLVMLPLAIAFARYPKMMGQEIIAPSGIGIWIALGTGLVWFWADYLYVAAYTNKGSLITITTILVMIPVLASVFRFYWIGGLPNRYHVVGYLLAAGAVLLVAMGNVAERRET